jgi:hypothetical protein
MEQVERFAYRLPRVAAGERPGASMRTTRGVNAQARPRSRHSGARRALAAPRDHHTWPTVPSLLCARPARIGTLDKNAQQPFCYASNHISEKSPSCSSFVLTYFDPSIKVKAIALSVLRIEPCPAVRLGDAALAQGHGQRQGRPRLRLCTYPRPMAQPRGGASTDGTTLEEVPQKIIKHNGFVTRPHRGSWFSYNSHTSFCAIASGTTRPRAFSL